MQVPVDMSTEFVFFSSGFKNQMKGGNYPWADRKQNDNKFGLIVIIYQNLFPHFFFLFRVFFLTLHSQIMKHDYKALKISWLYDNAN